MMPKPMYRTNNTASVLSLVSLTTNVPLVIVDSSTKKRLK